jgi:FHA domain
MATVLSLRAANGREYSVAGTLRIGRAPDNEICLTGDDLVSRLHARVWPEGDRLFICDEGSSNGTHVNGQALTPGNTYRLRPGDTVRVGATIFTVAASLAARAVTGPLPAPQAAEAAPAPVVPPPAAPPPVVPSPAVPSPVVPSPAVPSPAAPPPAAAPAAVPAGLPAGTRIDQGPFAAPAPAASRRSRNLLLGGCLALLLLVVCGGLGVFGLTAGRPAIATALAQVGAGVPGAPTPVRGTSAATPGPGSATLAAATPAATSGAFTVLVLPTVPPTAPLAPAAYAANSQAVAAALADLNQAQLRFIHDAAAGAPPGPASTDDLLNIAAASFKLASGAESLCSASAVQAGGSDAAGQVAGLYAGLARYGYAQALDAQNLRQALASGALKLPDAAARVADFGARAWNPSVTDPAAAGNPFLPFVGDPAAIPVAAPLSPAGAAALQTGLGPQAALQSWIAASAQTVTRTVSFPRPIRPLGDPQDPALLASLITAAGQADGDRASQAAAAGLQRLGATLTGATGSRSSLKGADMAAQAGADFMTYADMAAELMTAEQQPGGKAPPAIPGGTGAALAKTATGGEDAFINNVFSLGGDNTPTKTGQTPITTAVPLVTLSITNVQVGQVAKQTNGVSDADVQFTYDVTWHTSLVDAHFTINCNTQTLTANGSSGTLHVAGHALINLYPGNLSLHCYPPQMEGGQGAADLLVLVGDPAAATQRKAQQATEFEAIDLTLIAQLHGTATEAARQATLTQAVRLTQGALQTEQAATQTAEFAATVTEAAARTATANAAGIFTLNGTFNLIVSDTDCVWSAAPSTSGIVQMNVNFNSGQVTATFTGGGGGTRSLQCGADTADLHWHETYTADFSGTVNPASGALSLTGTLTGSNDLSWSNCKYASLGPNCPLPFAGGYTNPVTLSGTVDKASHTGSGTWGVEKMIWPASGDWGGG